ncbi:MAG: archaeosine biosynthesis radical SAM protein RaSEA, partial [Halobacteria archaeon]|nr:archaeosine biosynthesis radical SAM protein RaSEA [Halobacteria archaeon]
MAMETSVAVNKAMRRIRDKKERDANHDEPIRVWIDEDRTPDGVGKSVTIIFNTDGCRWARAGGCTMCGYVGESNQGAVTAESLLNQLEKALEHERNQGVECENVKMYTSGTFFDTREIPEEARHEILDTFSDRRVVVETLPDFVHHDVVEDAVSRVRDLDVAIGLETADDHIRRECINKYFDFDEFVRASEVADDVGAGVKTYLLMKPPFVTEEEAIEDMVYSIEKAAEYSHTVSMNPCNVQRYTLVDRLHYRGGYRPPWLWSVAEVLERTHDAPAITVSHPVGEGCDRGAHNCGEC